MHHCNGECLHGSDKSRKSRGDGRMTRKVGSKQEEKRKVYGKAASDDERASEPDGETTF